MGYPKQPKSEAEVTAALKQLRLLKLCQRLEDENTKWPSGDPLYMGLRREAAKAIREFLTSPEQHGGERADQT